ncbi:MAG: arginine N-succinyltransferase, partial [Verrucomicrobia bacterium]|nr:arginine N-succinyltransferase [Verrucomicrobiota bacterium]
MIIFRPIQYDDLPQFIHIASRAHLGFYTLPKSPKLLEHRIENSSASFQKEITTPGNELYLFAAVETDSNTLLGVSAIAATTGGNEPLYFFRKEYLDVPSHLPAVVKKIPLLTPISYVRGPSEICSLFVLPEYRHTGVGKLLSFARFFFVRLFPERFTGSFFAELRGIIDQNNSSPFWEGIGRHFFNMPLEQVHEMLEYGRGFISQFLPKHPIYISLLPRQVQEATGQIDSLTKGAFLMLQKLGFEVTDEIDLLDGGPKLRVLKENISIVKNSSIVTVVDIKD